MNETTAPSLRRLMENDLTLDEVHVTPTENYDDGLGVDFYNAMPGIAHIFPRGDFGWKMAGEIIGNNTSVGALAIRGPVVFPEEGGVGIEHLEAFFNGAKRNNHINRLSFNGGDMLGGAPFPLMAPLLENNSNLTMLTIWGCALGSEGVRLLASALSSCTHWLEAIYIYHCGIEDGDPFDELVTTLDMNCDGRDPTLEKLYLDGNNIGGKGCAALATMLSNPRCALKSLSLNHNFIDDAGLASLANYGISKNDKLTLLDIAKGNHITNQGWSALSRRLCNKDTITDTYLSNHTLNDLGQGERHTLRRRNVELPNELQYYLQLNSNYKVDSLDEEHPFTPIQKILDNHDDWNMSQFILDMSPLVEDELQMLPYILGWIDWAEISNRNFSGITNDIKRRNGRTLQSRRHSTIHQFVRSMPLIVVEKLVMHEK